MQLFKRCEVMKNNFDSTQGFIAPLLWSEESAITACERLSDDIRRLRASIARLGDSEKRLLAIELFHSTEPLEVAKKLGVPLSIANKRHGDLIAHMLELFKELD